MWNSLPRHPILGLWHAIHACPGEKCGCTVWAYRALRLQVKPSSIGETWGKGWRNHPAAMAVEAFEHGFCDMISVQSLLTASVWPCKLHACSPHACAGQALPLHEELRDVSVPVLVHGDGFENGASDLSMERPRCTRPSSQLTGVRYVKLQ